MSDCIFCKLANGEIPTATLYEDDDFRVILDAGPATKGHSLILPKKHFSNVFEMPDELLGKAASLAKKISADLMEKLGCDGINILQNNGTAAGQTVYHFHIHMIPRYEGEAQIVANWPQGTLTEETKAEILNKMGV